MFQPLPRHFYRPSAEIVAPLLLGHWLLRRTPDGVAGGVIVETEAYLANDPACHGYQRETSRNRTMYGEPGQAYVYFIYGMHYCFNAVCQPEGIAEAVLIRAIEPTFGAEIMAQYRTTKLPHHLTNGPAKLCAALNIDSGCDGIDICNVESPLFIARNPRAGKLRDTSGPVVTTTRIGITQAADWPLRFLLPGSQFVSRSTTNFGTS